ncbi:amidoligase family protein [Ruminococcus sp.]|uniref:amidoligase family protein n=1 Tax=Ruminococcus sp. TaxID=41978 RepID=UPI0025D143D7|nr:amidoligase family protein [Ruminococcus sp.]
MEETRTCTHCGNILAEQEGTIVGDDILCDECVADYCVTCDHCEETMWTEDCITDDHLYLCPDCYESHYHRCQNCDRIIHEDCVNWHCDMPYCDDCYDEMESDNEIEDYSYKPAPIFFGKGERFFGVELEVDDGGKYDCNVRQLKELANANHAHIYIKADGSLNDGFEIVSHPMTLDYHINEMDWETVLEKAVELGYRSHQTSTCGLHIHVNRDAFGENQAEQEEVIAKILYFVESHWNELFRFSRRKESSINRWSARYGFEKTGKEILDKAKDFSCGRYTAVNLRNYHTIEFRIFRGTLKYNTFIAALQLVNEICNTALFSSEDKLEKLSWSEFVRRIKEPELIQYLKEHQLYINEQVFGEEEM